MRFSIIMPVLNEAATLEKQLSYLTKQCASYDCELFIVDGGSSDETAEIAQRYVSRARARGAPTMEISDETVEIAQRYGYVISSPRGRATQMNAGAAIARGEVLLFLHADTRLPDEAFTAIDRVFASPKVVGGAFRICFNCDKWPYRLVAFITNLRSRTLFTGDQAYFIRASSFRAVGGYPDQPLMEDLEIIKQLRKIGKVVLLPDYVTTSARRHEKFGLLRTVLFMWYMRTLYKFGVSPAQLQRMYLDVR